MLVRQICLYRLLLCPQLTHWKPVCCGAVNQPLLSGKSVQITQQFSIVLVQSLLYKCLLTPGTQPADGSLVIQQQLATSEHLSLELSCLRSIWLENKHEQLQFKQQAAPVSNTNCVTQLWEQFLKLSRQIQGQLMAAPFHISPNSFTNHTTLLHSELLTDSVYKVK
jgi:hypothetical protein